MLGRDCNLRQAKSLGAACDGRHNPRQLSSLVWTRSLANMKSLRGIRNRSSPSGLTFIEMLLVLALGGIILTMAIFPIAQSVRRTRVDRASRVIAMDLELAFSIAARQRQPVRITFDNSERGYEFADLVPDTVLRRRSLGPESEYQLQSMTAAPTSIDSLPTGLASTFLEVTVSTADQSRTVTMSRAGHIRVVR